MRQAPSACGLAGSLASADEPPWHIITGTRATARSARLPNWATARPPLVSILMQRPPATVIFRRRLNVGCYCSCSRARWPRSPQLMHRQERLPWYPCGIALQEYDKQTGATRARDSDPHAGRARKQGTMPVADARTRAGGSGSRPRGGGSFVSGTGRLRCPFD